MPNENTIRLYKQAQQDLKHAYHSVNIGHNEWACNSARQCAEKILKALFHKFGLPQPRSSKSHEIEWLLNKLSDPFYKIEQTGIPKNIYDEAYELDHIFYQNAQGQTSCCLTAQTEYFDSPPLGNKAPFEVIDSTQAQNKINAAEIILNWAIQFL